MRLDWGLIAAFLLAVVLGVLLFNPIVNLYSLGQQAGIVVNALQNLEQRQVKVEKFLITQFQPTPNIEVKSAAPTSSSPTPGS